MREDFPERPEMEDMRRLVELYARGHLPQDVFENEARRAAFTFKIVAPVRRWVAALLVRRSAAEETTARTDADIACQRVAR
jgi:hypothetical protein